MRRLSFFSEQLAQGMSLQRMSAKTLAKQAGCSYEHVRKMAISEVLPSATLLRKVCEIFHWNEKRVSRFVRWDRARKKFGKNFWVWLGLNPECEDFYILWEFLTKQEQQLTLDVLRFYVARKQTEHQEASTPSLHPPTTAG